MDRSSGAHTFGDKPKDEKPRHEKPDSSDLL
jgi:hypothetical protein